MPEPLHPPFSPANQQPRTLNRWLDHNHQGGALTRTRGYFILPAFDITPTWKGYSEIVASFNFSSPNNFSITNFVGSNSGNYVLCLAYADSNGKVYRYRFSGSGGVFYFTIPAYNGQLILKNFRIEVWSINANNATLTSPISLLTSVLSKQYDYRFGDDFALASNGGLVTDFANINEVTDIVQPDLTNLSLWFDPAYGTIFSSGTLVNRWNSKVGAHYLQQATVANQPNLHASATPQYVQFIGDAQMDLDSAPGNITDWLVLLYPSVGGSNTKQVYWYSAPVEALRFTGGVPNSAMANFLGDVVSLTKLPSSLLIESIIGTGTLRQYDIAASTNIYESVDSAGDAVNGPVAMHIGDITGLLAGKGYDIIEILGYNGNFDYTQTLRYLMKKYQQLLNDVWSLPLTWHQNAVVPSN